MKKYDVIIIGAGLGGLECGYILSKKGYNVCILEKHFQVGGCLQTFKRGATTFDTGFHFVGGLSDGQPLNRLFKYFDLMELPWQKLDDKAFAEVILNGESYNLAQGYDAFVESLTQKFPHQRQELKNYVSLLSNVEKNIESIFDIKAGEEHKASDYFGQSAYQFLNDNFSDKKLIDVVSGASLTMELSPDTLPLYVFAQINNSFIKSSWRLKNGGDQIAKSLVANIEKMGGTVITNAEVTNLEEVDGKITAVEYNDEKISADYVISNLHPTATINLIKESKVIKRIYRNRMNGLENTFGMFTAHLSLKPNTERYQNKNIFVYSDSPWNVLENTKNNRLSSALISSQVPSDGVYTNNIDILTPISWNEVSAWESTSMGRRGEDYKAFKEKKISELLDFVSERMPSLKSNIDKVYSSSPLTYRDYTGTVNGSAYGIQKDFSRPLQTILTPNTPIENLLLTGQNLNLHGILGVTMTSLFTSAKIVGLENIVKDI